MAIDDTETPVRKDPQLVLAKAIWREQSKRNEAGGSTKETTGQDWRENKKEFVSLARRLVRRLEKEGIALVEKS
ncbi:MAG: hypothetical protein H0T75_07730 [Rhizobiales bacterium]|nr:hypothetical protein [Hyphomicrobiales bacterium]